MGRPMGRSSRWDGRVIFSQVKMRMHRPWSHFSLSLLQTVLQVGRKGMRKEMLAWEMAMLAICLDILAILRLATLDILAILLLLATWLLGI
jgi:hypothetical protein